MCPVWATSLAVARYFAYCDRRYGVSDHDTTVAEWHNMSQTDGRTDGRLAIGPRRRSIARCENQRSFLIGHILSRDYYLQHFCFVYFLRF